MADITLTTPVTPTGSLANVEIGIAAVAITAGQPVYRDAATSGQLRLADADTEAAAQCVGVAVCSAGIGEACAYAKSGATITQAGTTFTKGTAYFVSTVAGGIAPQADLASGDYVTCLGIAISTSALKLDIQISGITV